LNFHYCDKREFPVLRVEMSEFSVSHVLSFIIMKSECSHLEHCNEQKFPSYASPLLASRRAEIEINQLAVKYDFDDAFS